MNLVIESNFRLKVELKDYPLDDENLGDFFNFYKMILEMKNVGE